MAENKRNYCLKVCGNIVDVDEEIYYTFYRMQEREIYLEKRDRCKGLIYYSSWDTETSLGSDFMIAPDNTEEKAINNIDSETIWRCVEEANDENNICFLIGMGYTEREIAEICGISQAAVNKKKRKLFQQIKNLLKERNFIE